MPFEQKIKALAEFVRNLSDFTFYSEIGPEDDYQYAGHMGALITDAVLQAGLTWETTVHPRAVRIQQQYPEARTTSGFLQVLELNGAARVVDWKDEEKPQRLLGVVKFFVKEQVETVDDLRRWLESPSNSPRLRELRGIGPKTVDYFKMQAGIDTNAVNRYLQRFLDSAAIPVGSYEEANEIINRTADTLGMGRQLFDFSVWKYMNARKKRR